MPALDLRGLMLFSEAGTVFAISLVMIRLISSG